MTIRAEITHAAVCAALRYDPETGHLFWIISPNGKVPAGSRAGKLRSDGYIVVGLFGRRFYGHRLVFFIAHGRWPDGETDHESGVRNINKIENLRDATKSQNGGNHKIRSDNRSGFKGVTFQKSHRLWRARITVSCKRRWLGYFKTPEEAHAAYAIAAKEAFSDFHRVS